MAYKTQIAREIREVSALQSLTEVYGEIAAIRMKKIRGLVLKNRDFLSAIESIFKDALSSYSEKLFGLFKAGKIRAGQKVTFLSHNGKTVAVLISANTRFYGDVVKETFEKFIDEIRRGDFEVTIIGRVGRSMFMAAEPKRPYTYFDLPDFGADPGQVSETIKHLVQYEQIRVYFAKYFSVVSQKPSTFDISAGAKVEEVKGQAKTAFIFEPSLEKVLKFFETQIFASLFDQSIRESQLAKSASRILAMDKAAASIKKRLKEIEFESTKLKHIEADKRLMDIVVPVLHIAKS